MNNVYGTNIPSRVTADDVDIFYAYHESRNSDSVEKSAYSQLPSSILSSVICENESGFTDTTIEGLYNIKLPLQYFNRKGYYTVYIKPKEYQCVIADVSSLTNFPNVRGIVLDSTAVDNDVIKNKIRTNNALVGYRVIYVSDAGKRMDEYRLVTSNNRCEPTIQASDSNMDKTYSYRYNETSTLSFLTLTPSSAPTFKSNAAPYIGKPTQRVILVNTLFEPVMLDIEMTDKDIESLSYMLEGSQLRDLDNGLITTYDNNNQIYHQSEHYTIKDVATGKPVYEIKKNKQSNIDFSQDITDKL